MRAGGTSCSRGFVRALRSKTHRDVPGRKINDRCRNEERGYLAWAAFHQGRVLAFDDVESADARSDMNANVLGILRRDLQARHLHRFFRRGKSKVDKATHLL